MYKKSEKWYGLRGEILMVVVSGDFYEGSHQNALYHILSLGLMFLPDVIYTDIFLTARSFL